jgi:Hint domain
MRQQVIPEHKVSSSAACKFTGSADATDDALIGIACYRHGTRIATPLGDVPVEALRIGDAVLTASGRVRPIRWIGRRSYSAEAVGSNRQIQPIRIAAGALDGELPRRDLWVSPEHALLFADEGGDVLVPAHLLVNGASITRQSDAEPVAYLHMELEGHEAILAEGQAAETFLDKNTRAIFANAAEYAALYPHAGRPEAQYCAPRVTGGAVLARIRGRLDALAQLAPGPLDSHVDVATRVSVSGWAHDRANPASPVLVEILVNDATAGFVLADRYRADLRAAGIGDGYCSFSFCLPTPLSAGRRHIISVRRAADGVGLFGSLVLIDRGEDPHSLIAGTLRQHAPAAMAESRADIARFLAAQIDTLRRRAA